jgi:hypothetical protein
MLAGVEAVASFPRAQECKSLIIELIWRMLMIDHMVSAKGGMRI